MTTMTATAPTALPARNKAPMRRIVIARTTRKSWVARLGAMFRRINLFPAMPS